MVDTKPKSPELPIIKGKRTIAARDDKFIDNVANIYGIRSEGGPYFYVGSTITSLHRRFTQHKRECQNLNHSNGLFLEKALDIGLDNLRIDLLERTNNLNRYVREYAWLNRLRDDGIEMVNICGSRKQEILIALSIKNKNNFNKADWQRKATGLVSYCLIFRNATLPYPKSLVVEVVNDFLKDMFKECFADKYKEMFNPQNYQTLTNLRNRLLGLNYVA